jgi:hypothetical protein
MATKKIVDNLTKVYLPDSSEHMMMLLPHASNEFLLPFSCHCIFPWLTVTVINTMLKFKGQMSGPRGHGLLPN